MKNISRFFFLLAFLYGSQSFGQTVTAPGGALTPPATTSGVVSFPVAVAGAPGSTITGVTVPNINVPAVLGYNTQITNISMFDAQHTFAADLDLRLVSPAGAVYTFNTDNGGSTGLDVTSDMIYDVTATDCADSWTSSTSAAQPENGLLFEVVENTCGPIDPGFSFVCLGNAGQIVGDSVNGTWTLEVTDDAGGDTGSFTNFSLTFASITPPTMDSSGLPIVPSACGPATPIPTNSPLTLLVLATSVGLAGGLAVLRRRRKSYLS